MFFPFLLKSASIIRKPRPQSAFGIPGPLSKVKMDRVMAMNRGIASEVATGGVL